MTLVTAPSISIEDYHCESGMNCKNYGEIYFKTGWLMIHGKVFKELGYWLCRECASACILYYSDKYAAWISDRVIYER